MSKEVRVSPCSIRADIVGVEVLVAADVEPSAADDGVGKVRVGGLLFNLKPAGDVESVISDIEQVHCALVVQGVDSYIPLIPFT